MARRGFTLLESLLVLFLISLVFSLVVPTLVAPKPSLAQKEAMRFMTLLMQYRDRASAGGQVLGVHVQVDGYRFLQRYQGAWIPMPSSSSRQATTVMMDKTVHLTLTLPLTQPAEPELAWYRQRLQLHDMPSGLTESTDSLRPPRPAFWFVPAEPPRPFVAEFTTRDGQACWQVRMAGEALRLLRCGEESV